MDQPVSKNLDGAAAASARGSSEFQRDLVALIPYLRSMSRAMCSNKPIAEDMTQDALAKAWRSRNHFEPGSNLKAWVFTILRNQIYSQKRRAWREVCWDPVLGEKIPAPAQEQERAMELSDVARGLDNLPEGQREALILVAVGGFSYRIAADICTTPAGTAKSRVARARAALFEVLEGNKTLPARSARRATEVSDDILAQLGALAERGADITHV